MGPLLTTLSLLCTHSSRTWIFSSLGSLRRPWQILSVMCGMEAVSNLPFCPCNPAGPWLDDHGCRRPEGPEGQVQLVSCTSAPTRSTSQHRWKEPSCMALTAASWRFSRKRLSATNKEPSSMVENIPGWKVSCTILWGLGILAGKISPPASDSSLGSINKKD